MDSTTSPRLALRRLRDTNAVSISLLAAATLPALLAFNLPPSPTFFNQAAALLLWGIVALTTPPPHRHRAKLEAAALQIALVLTASAACVAIVQGLPQGLSLSALGLILATMLCAAVGSTARSVDRNHATATAFFAAWLAAGVLGALIGVAQVFGGELLDGELIARSGLTGRAVGNLRQPNHLSSLLLWSAVAVVPLLQRQRMPVVAGWVLYGFLLFGLVLTGSRTGIVGALVLTLWGALDRRLVAPARSILLSTPLLFGLFWLLMAWWAHETQNTFGAAAHVLGAELSSSRFAIWSNTLTLIARNPLFGVGFGEFNFAWSLTPFPDRPVAFFDHTHNLPLQLAVELGIPLALLILGLLGWALWKAFRNSVQAEGDDGVALRAGFVMVLMMALHSQLEYPLWYAYFLLPTAWIWGYLLAAGAPVTPSSPDQKPRRSWVLTLGGIAMVVGAGIAVVDYLRVAQIFAPSDNAAPLAERIADGQRSIFFAHHADYAAATTATDPLQAIDAFKRAPHYLLDTRLMMAWARTLAAQGEMDKAKHIAARLREFRNPASDEFFKPCEKPGATEFQCSPPSREVDWREFRSPR